MKALCWEGVQKVRVENVPDPIILNPHDAIIKVTSTAICGSDLHLYDGFIPTMQHGDILGHEFMGTVVQVGPGVKKLRVDDRVVVPFAIACGECDYCKRGLTSLCDNSNPNAWMMEASYGYAGSGLYGYSHLMGGYSGGQAEYVRVPFADFNPFKVPKTLTDEQVLFLTDIFPTGYQAVENGGVKPGSVVAVWGCGPVGQFAIRCAFEMGAEKVIAIDKLPYRLEMARAAGAEPVNWAGQSIFDAIHELTGGRGPDVVIDAVGLEAEGHTPDALVDRAGHKVMLNTDLAHALREEILACAKGGTISLAGVYGGMLNMVPLGAAFGKGLTLKMGQTNVHRYLPMLLAWVEQGKIDPTVVITHQLPLEEAPMGYKIFKERIDDCMKVVLKP